MFIFKHKPLLIMLICMSQSAFAGNVRINCAQKYLNALNRLEIKGATPLEIIEYKIDKPIDYIFGQHTLEIAPYESKIKNKTAILRNPAVSRAIMKKGFEETRFISDLPAEDLTSVLKPNTRYSYVIQDEKLTFAESKPGILRDISSRHVVLGSDKKAGPVRMVGEFWKDEKGILHFDPSSKTYLPGSEDLKRASQFFKEHMGIKNAVPHMPASTITVEKSIPERVISQVKNIEIGQLAILNKRRFLSGYKMTVIKQDREKKMNIIEGEHIKLVDVNDKEITYKVIRMDTIIREETIFDTIDLKLNDKHQQIISSKTFPQKDESIIKKKTALSENEGAVISARKSIGNDPLLPVAKTRTESEQYGLYPVNANGKLGKAAFVVTIDSRTTTGQAGRLKGKTSGDATVTVEDLSTGNSTKTKQLEQLTDHIQKRFELSGTVSDKDAGTISSLES